MKILIVFFLNTAIIFGNNYSDYFDLSINNVYVYQCYVNITAPPTSCTSNFRLKVWITDTVTNNGKKYAKYEYSYVLIQGTCSFEAFLFSFLRSSSNLIRLDTADGNIYYYNPDPCNYLFWENKMDSLNCRLNDVVNFKCVPEINNYNFNCIDTTGRRKFNSSSDSYQREYIKGIGLYRNFTSRFYSGLTKRNEQLLLGSVINGVVYGDTTFPIYPLGIQNSNSDVTSEFSLSQNYPNPFNPTTHFGFRIAEFGLVRLTVFDMLGKEVTVLVNKDMRPGTYEADWDASEYPSGVYYYKLKSGDFTETKKMVLLK